MKIICDKEILNKSINIAIRAVSSKSTQATLKCLLLKAQDKFTITGNDLKLAIETAPIDANIIETGSILIDARLFADVARKLPNGDVSIETDDDHFVYIQCGKSEFKLLGMETSEFPDLPTIEKDKPLNVKGNILSNMINKTIFSVATEDVKPTLTGELIEIENNTLNVVAIDGFRVAHMVYSFEEDVNDISIIVPAKALDEISKILGEDDEDAKIYKTNNHMLVESSKGIVVTRLLDGEYMEYKRIFTEEYSTKIKINKNEIIDCLERAILVAREGKRTPVKFVITDSKIVITSNTEKGNSVDEIFIQTDGEDLTIAFNPKYLVDVFKAMEDEEITIQFTNALSPCIIKGTNNINYKYLVLPLRLKG